MTKQPEIPSVLRALRSSLQLTQEQLAERLGVSFATVNRWEGGTTQPQKAAADAIRKLAEEVGIGETSETSVSAVAARRRGRTGAAVPSTKPMEQMLWDAACSIRGEKDAAKFKDYLLPLLFLKRLSDVFDDEIARLAEEYGDRATALEIAEGDHSLLRFYLPPEARWGVISGREAYKWPTEKGRSTAPKDIGEHLTKAVRAVAKQNPSLSGVIDVVDFAAERNGERDVNPAKLRGVVETFSDPRYRLGLADVQPDFLGRAYEYLLRKFAEGSGQSAGEFFTPTEVGFLMAHILRPRPGETCHDYACGSAGLLIKLQLVARELDPTSKVPLKLSGQELQAESYAVAQMNAIIHDMDVELQRGDTMINPKFRTADSKIATHDIVVANPMWNQPFSQDIFINDPFDRFRPAGGITSGKGDWAWLQHTYACMNDHGRAAVVLDTGAVTRGSGSKNEDRERNIRKWFVDRDLIDGVILLPENLFYNTTGPGVVVVLSKRKPTSRQGKITLVNASGRTRKGRPKNYLSEADIRAIASMYWKGEPVDGEVAVIDLIQAAGADYNLSPSRWVVRNGSARATSIPEILAELHRLTEEETLVTAEVIQLLEPLSRNDLQDERRGEEQKETDFGSIPQSWSLVPIAELTKQMQYGLSVRGGSTGRFPILRMNCQVDGKVVMRDLQFVDLSDELARDYKVNVGDILFNRTNSYELVGRTAIVEEETDAVFASYLVRVVADEGKADPRYLNYFLNWDVAQAVLKRLASRGVSQANISAGKLREFEIPAPPIKEQEAIAQVLAALDRKRNVARRKSVVLDRLNQALLHKLMTGEVRVRDLDLSAIPAQDALAKS